jgi:hypothetical protein
VDERILNRDGRIGQTIDQWRGGGESNSLRKIERQLKMTMTTRDKIIGIAGIGVAILLVVALFSSTIFCCKTAQLSETPRESV